MPDPSHRSAQVVPNGYVPAVWFRGLWYASTCCHQCALVLCAASEGLTIDQIAADEAEFSVGYENEKGEFCMIPE